MKLDRNINADGRGKYALIKLRTSPIQPGTGMATVDMKDVDFGDTPETDFFVIRLKDKYAAPALAAYAGAAICDDPEYAGQVYDLALAAAMVKNQRRPD